MSSLQALFCVAVYISPCSWLHGKTCKCQTLHSQSPLLFSLLPACKHCIRDRAWHISFFGACRAPLLDPVNGWWHEQNSSHMMLLPVFICRTFPNGSVPCSPMRACLSHFLSCGLVANLEQQQALFQYPHWRLPILWWIHWRKSHISTRVHRLVW